MGDFFFPFCTATLTQPKTKIPFNFTDSGFKMKKVFLFYLKISLVSFELCDSPFLSRVATSF